MTIAIFCLFASSITSLSLIEPPGWIMHEIPLSDAILMLSLNGKKPSDAITESFVSESAAHCF